ncbi:MAG: hypothetical protein ACO3F2_08005 [Roseiflexaceae bacterium]
MNSSLRTILVVLDDREYTNESISSIVGHRHYAEIIYRRQKLVDYIQQHLTTWTSQHFYHLQNSTHVAALRHTIESKDENTGILLLAGRAGIANYKLFTQLLERLPYAEERLANCFYHPMVFFFHQAHHLLEHWSQFQSQPIHLWDANWHDVQQIHTINIYNLSVQNEFINFISGSTDARHFNQVNFDRYYYTKRSTDKKKMQAEFLFYTLTSERMRTWLVQPFEYIDEGNTASYKMMRYYLADVALQWVHNAFDIDTFQHFLERLFFFISERPQQSISKQQSLDFAHTLFVTKLQKRLDAFLESQVGQNINQLLMSSNPQLNVQNLLQRFERIYYKNEQLMASSYAVIGHGDPCFSNILYDQNRQLMKLIDPKGGTHLDELWTHPIYDLCKISHSILGNYDFINNGLFNVSLTDSNEFSLSIQSNHMQSYQKTFTNMIAQQKFNYTAIRIGEASLFLSMIPLHTDHPKKVIAFIITANRILDEVTHV